MFSVVTVAAKSFQIVKNVLCHQTFHTVTGSSKSLVKSGTPLLSQIRNVIRCHFPRPKEVKRVRVYGWEKRISTNNGRKVIMRRILKGRHVLSH